MGDTVRITTRDGTRIEIVDHPLAAKLKTADQLASPAANTQEFHEPQEPSVAQLPELRFVSKVRSGFQTSQLRRKPNEIEYRHLFFTFTKKEDLETLAKSLATLLSKHTENTEDVDSVNYTHALRELKKAIEIELNDTITADTKENEIHRKTHALEYLPRLYEDTFIQQLYKIANDKYGTQDLKTSALNLLSFLKQAADYQVPAPNKEAPF